MRKSIIYSIVILLVFSGICFAENWHKVDSAIVAWDQPTVLYDGTPLPAGIQSWIYNVYTKDVSGANINNVGQITEAQATITISEGGKVYIGISAAYIDVDGLTSDESDIAWSDNPTDCQNGITFGLHNLKRPGKATNLRLP